VETTMLNREKTLIHAVLAFAVLVSLPQESAKALEVAGWRMDGLGSYPAATPPAEWSPTKNLVWSTPLKAWSNSSQVLMGGMLFFTAEPETLMCADAATGKILWEKTNTYEDAATPEEKAKIDEAKKASEPIKLEIQKLQAQDQDLRKQIQAKPDDADLKKKAEETKAKLKEENAKLEPYNLFLPPKTHGSNGYSSPTPVTDGKNVYAVFGNGVVAAYSVKGDRLWIRHLENPTNQWGHSSSPVLAAGKLLIHVLDLYALNPETGKTEWSAKVKNAWGTAVEVKIGDTPAVLTPAGDLVRISDGHVMATNLASVEYNTPIVHDGIAYFIEAGGKAIKLPEKAADTVTPTVLWQTKPVKERYYASPLLYEDRIYAITRYGAFSIIDAKTGAVLFASNIDYKTTGEFYPSITLAGKNLYVSGDKGTILVVEPGSEYKEVGRINIGQQFRASPIFDGKRIYIRGYRNLFCFGE
jgi:outer membrane protein assembly factor BamB